MLMLSVITVMDCRLQAMVAVAHSPFLSLQGRLGTHLCVVNTAYFKAPKVE